MFSPFLPAIVRQSAQVAFSFGLRGEQAFSQHRALGTVQEVFERVHSEQALEEARCLVWDLQSTTCNTLQELAFRPHSAWAFEHKFALYTLTSLTGKRAKKVRKRRGYNYKHRNSSEGKYLLVLLSRRGYWRRGFYRKYMKVWASRHLHQNMESTDSDS